MVHLKNEIIFMIPDFPNFTHLEIADKFDIEKFTNEYPPYSDFNFMSLWSWDTQNNIQISKLNNNLVILFSDYVTGKPFLSFLGQNNLKETALTLIKFSKNKYNVNFLKLIPEEVANTLLESGLKVKLDLDSSDYIFSIKNLINMNTWPNHTAGQKIRNFIKKYPNYRIEVSKLNQLENKDIYINLFHHWAKHRNIENLLELNEFKSFKRFLHSNEDGNSNIEVISLFLEEVLIGFSIYEIILGEYAISHFIKGNTKEYPYIYDILNWEEAKILDSKNVKYYNWEQDLGISGLKSSKEKYKPSFFLKKYIIKEGSFYLFLLNLIKKITQ